MKKITEEVFEKYKEKCPSYNNLLRKPHNCQLSINDGSFCVLFRCPIVYWMNIKE